MEIEHVEAKLKEALDTLDNYEALNRLSPEKHCAWLMARRSLLQAMGYAVALGLVE